MQRARVSKIGSLGGTPAMEQRNKYRLALRVQAARRTFRTFWQELSSIFLSGKSGSMGLILLFLYMLLSSIFLVAAIGIRQSPLEWQTVLLTLGVGWFGFITTSRSTPGAWLLADMLTGNSHRLTKRFAIDATIITKCATSGYDETIRATRTHNSRWPYSGWDTRGEKFLIIELKHQGETFRTCMKVNHKEYVLAHPGDSIPVKYQLARGPDGPGNPVLAWLS
jgi:hypothetical protein